MTCSGSGSLAPAEPSGLGRCNQRQLGPKPSTGLQVSVAGDWAVGHLPPTSAMRGRMLAWFQALMPKEERFVELFVRHSHTLVAAAQALRNLLQGGDMAPRHCREIVAREHDADEITRE